MIVFKDFKSYKFILKTIRTIHGVKTEIANFVNNKGLATKNASFFKNTNCATSVNGRKMPHTSLSPR